MSTTTSTTPQVFKGPLGLWNWPFLNAFLARMRPASNSEKWVWTDWRGRERIIEVARQVH
jgi:hypothetical protein